MNCKEYTNAIAYYRVSTTKQGDSGLGLDAQQTAVSAYASAKCLQVVETFTEIETGTNKRKRPQIANAIKAAKEHDAVLLVAKLDRLARNVHFISGLIESGVKFVAVDNPTIDNLTIHILAAVAEQEAKLISKRTKDALAEKTRCNCADDCECKTMVRSDGREYVCNGGSVGCPCTEWRVSGLSHDDRTRGANVRKQQAIDAYAHITPYIRRMRNDGMSYKNCSIELNEAGNRTINGKQFTAATVSRILKRAES